MYVFPILSDLTHVAGWDPYTLHDLARASWVGSVQCRSRTTSHNGRWETRWSIYRSSLQVKQNTCEVLVPVWFDYCCRWHHQEQRMHHYVLRTTTTFIDHSPLLMFNNYASSWPRPHQDGIWHGDVTKIFYRGLSHVKSTREQSTSRVYHLLSSIQLLRYALLYQCPVWC